jgi:serine phosphatase RsbU (regulator of sigma subunit)
MAAAGQFLTFGDFVPNKDAHSSKTGQPVASGIVTLPDTPTLSEPIETSVNRAEHPFLNVAPSAAEALVRTVFGDTQHRIPRIRYATAFKLAEGKTGGDIIDVFHYDNDHVSFAVADIAGKGTLAAVHAAMIKYGLRSFVSNGLTPEKVMRSLDRLYLENNAFEQVESFACIFLGVVDTTRRLLHYTNAAMESVLVIHSDGTSKRLEHTAPLVGVFEDQHHLFKQSFVELRAGSLLVVATDGVTEARDRKGKMLGIERIREIVLRQRTESECSIAAALLAEAESFSDDQRRDDIAIIVARFL